MAVLGFDIGGTSVKYGVVEESGAFLQRGKFATPQRDIRALVHELRQVKVEMAGKYSLQGAGMSFPGAVDEEKDSIGDASSITCIHGFAIRELLERELQLPVAMENDANCAALGELWLGAAQGKKDVVFVVCGSGIGGAVIKSRQIHKGAHLHGGEFGYMVLDDSGQILSEAASPVAMARRVAAALGVSAAEMTGEKAFQLAAKGNFQAQCEIDRMYRQLARAVYNIQYMYDPEVIVIGGAISVREDMIARLDHEVDEILTQVKIARIRPQICCCRFGNDANLLGAVYHFLQAGTARTKYLGELLV